FKSNIAAKQVPVSILLKQGATTVLQKDSVMDIEVGRTYAQQIALEKFFKKDLDNHIHASVGLTLNNRQQFFSSYLRAIKYD
ncbi:hypothetical protein ACJEKX_24190, partial [Escherichia coli]